MEMIEFIADFSWLIFGAGIGLWMLFFANKLFDKNSEMASRGAPPSRSSAHGFSSGSDSVGTESSCSSGDGGCD